MFGGAVLAAAAAGALLSLTPGTNGSFETVKELPKEWELVQYVAGSSTATVERGDAADGKQFLRLTATKPNHTRVFLPVDVDADTIYKFSAKVRATGGGDDVPAVLMVDGSTTTTESVKGDDKWVTAELYLKTGSATKAVPTLSFGRFGELAQGSVDFDSVALEKVDAIPEGAISADVTPPADAAATTPASAADSKASASPLLVPLAIALIALIVWGGRALNRADVAAERQDDDEPTAAAEPAAAEPSSNEPKPADEPTDEPAKGSGKESGGEPDAD